MTLETLSFVLGAVLLLTGILGGGFEVKELKIPKISGTARVLAMVAGLVFVALAFTTSRSPGDGDDKRPTYRMSEKKEGVNIPGFDYYDFKLQPNEGFEVCRAKCEKEDKCKAWVYTYPKPVIRPNPHCWLKSGTPEPVPDPLSVSGTKEELGN